MEIEFTTQAQTDLARLDRKVGQRVFNKLRWLSEKYDSILPEALTAQWQGFYKLRVGDYRVVYTVEESKSKTITVHFVRHRREVYKLR